MKEDDEFREQQRRPKTVFLNAARLDFDHTLSFERLAKVTDLTLYDKVDNLTTVSSILEHIPTNTEIIITKEMEIPMEAFHEFPSSVKLLCEAGTGYNNLPVDEARKKNVLVCNVPTYSTESVAHLAITYMMNFSCSMFGQQRLLEKSNDRINFKGPFTLPLHELGGKTLGLIGGSGEIGSKVADIALALGMNIVISSRKGSLPSDHRHYHNNRVRVVTKLEDLMPLSDYVSIHCPLNEETKKSIDGRLIRLMKSNAYLINTARGGIINEIELIECLKENVIAGAGLDVTDGEPPSDDSELWTLDNCILTPHIGWRRQETRQRLLDMTIDNIENYIEGNPSNVVNKI